MKNIERLDNLLLNMFFYIIKYKFIDKIIQA
jgi:hypothetical protein